MKLALGVPFIVAQLLGPIVNFGAPRSAPSYTGPGNIVSGAVAWWGFRGYNGAYSGNCCVICTASDAACETETISGGNLVLGTLGTTCLTSGTCLVKTMYDQSGANACAGSTACDVTQATVADQPAFTAAALHSIPCATFNGAQYLETANSLTLAQPFSYSAVAKRTGADTSINVIFTHHSTLNPFFAFAASTNTFEVTSGTAITATAADGSFHVIEAVQNGSSPASSLTIDGTTTTGSSGAHTYGDDIDLGAAGFSGSNYLNGPFCEGGIWSVAFTSTQITNLTNNQNSYWGL